MNFNKPDNESYDDKNETELEKNKIRKYATVFVTEKPEPMKIPVKLSESSYTVQLISIGTRPDNIYEAKMILAPEVDMSTIKITVKDNNLRVRVRKSLDNTFKLLQKTNKSLLDDLIEKSVKHCENFLIPESTNDEKVRAIMDNKRRLLIITAPTKKFGYDSRKRVPDTERT